MQDFEAFENRGSKAATQFLYHFVNAITKDVEDAGHILKVDPLQKRWASQMKPSNSFILSSGYKKGEAMVAGKEVPRKNGWIKERDLAKLIYYILHYETDYSWKYTRKVVAGFSTPFSNLAGVVADPEGKIGRAEQKKVSQDIYESKVTGVVKILRKAISEIQPLVEERDKYKQLAESRNLDILRQVREKTQLIKEKSDLEQKVNETKGMIAEAHHLLHNAKSKEDRDKVLEFIEKYTQMLEKL